jgi:catechol 2,3-dioxygenase
MPTRLQLSTAHAVIYARDVAGMIAFYTEVLGFEVTDRGPLDGLGIEAREIVFLSQSPTDHHQLALISGRAAVEPSNSTHHVAFRSAGSLDDLRSLRDVLVSDPRVAWVQPLCHGNAWSVYFADPESNGVEVFLDTPWHVAQPQGKPLDLDASNDEIIAATRAMFGDEPEFGPMEDFHRRRASRLA